MFHKKFLFLSFTTLVSINIYSNPFKFENNYIVGCAPRLLCGSIEIKPKNNNNPKISLVAFEVGIFDPYLFKKSQKTALVATTPDALAIQWSDHPTLINTNESYQEKIKRAQQFKFQETQERFKKLGTYTFTDNKPQKFFYHECKHAHPTVHVQKRIYCYIETAEGLKNVSCKEVVDITTIKHKAPCIGIAKPSGKKDLKL